MRSSNLPVKNRTPDFSPCTREDWKDFDTLISPLFKNDCASNSSDVSTAFSLTSDPVAKSRFSFLSIFAECFGMKKDKTEIEKTNSQKRVIVR